MTRWPIRELLRAGLAALNAERLEQYRFETLIWAVTAPHVGKGSRRAAPKAPVIAKERKRAGD